MKCQLPAANELHNLNLGARIDRSGRPDIFLHDRPVQFHRDPFRVKSQRSDHLPKRSSRRELTLLPIHSDPVFHLRADPCISIVTGKSKARNIITFNAHNHA